jgi:uncharacterized protein (TIGR02284 family)
MNDKKKTIATLNELIEICKDGEEGFREAADGIQDSDLKSLFLDYSTQRAEFATELQDEVERLGGNPENKGTVSGAIHRGWIKLKEAVKSNDDAALINEAERSEDAAKEAYERALQMDLPADVLSLVEREYTEVKEAHDRVSELQAALS